jgi:hypothetical protein
MDDFQPLIWETFVIRLRRESANVGWRGQIVHLSDRETAHFATLDQAIDFIRRFAPEIDLHGATRDAHDEADVDQPPG